MFKSFICTISLILLLSATSSIQAEPFSIGAVQDGHACNDEQHGPAQTYTSDGLHIRNIDVRHRVALISYDISEFTGKLFSNVTFSNYGYNNNGGGMVDVYGLVEAQENFDETTITWNNAPGVQNDPTPPITDPVALDFTDLVGPLLTFQAPARGVRASTEPNQALDDFLNSDTNGLVTFLFAPVGGSDTIIRSKEHSEGGTFLEGDVSGFAKTATKPNPGNGVDDVPRDVVLSWTPGESADKHDVYLGIDFEDVNSATPTFDPNGVYKGRQDPNYYPAIGKVRLEFGKTYYWRIDEIDMPQGQVYPGTVWSFMVEPFAYAIDQITAIASSQDKATVGPENTINGSGLDETGLIHGNDVEGNMWLSSSSGTQPTWIEYEFDKVYKLHKMWIWNFNGPWITHFGLNNVKIEYSTDGNVYTTLGSTHEFAQADGEDNYTHNTVINLDGITAKYIRITANSNWSSGTAPQYGLSEVRFFYIPIRAREPNPDSDATDVDLDVTLNWRAGREATEHNVYFSPSWKDVVNGTAPMETVTETSYGPLPLDLSETYFWRVDEVNEPGNPEILEGDVWNFTTHEFFVVDDFEIYDANENQIWAIWHEGIGYWDLDGVFHPGNGTGSGVGDEDNENSYMEETIVNSGSKSMPYFFNNTGSTGKAYYSEAKLTLSSMRDWTQKGVKALTLWFQGYPASVGSFTEDPVGTYTMTATGADIFGTADEFHYAYQMLSGGGSIEAQVLSVENTDDWALAGVMIRDTLEPGSKFAAVCITSENGCRFRARLETDAGATSDTSVSTPEQRAITAPYWVKLERSIGGGFRGYYSSDGSNWVPMSWNLQNIQMNAEVYIGLAVTSHNVDAICQAQFSNVTSTGTDPWLNQDVGLLSNDPEPMYVAIANNNGTTGTVYYEDNDNIVEDATQIDTWTEWNIDLKDFQDQGVNLADVNSIAIGIGTRGSTTSGGEGKMYFDDIRLYPSRCILSRRSDDFAMLDYVEDCIVDYKELELMAGDWLASEPNPAVDLNMDGVLDFKDYAILADEWLEEQLWPQS